MSWLQRLMEIYSNYVKAKELKKKKEQEAKPKPKPVAPADAVIVEPEAVSDPDINIIKTFRTPPNFWWQDRAARGADIANAPQNIETTWTRTCLNYSIKGFDGDSNTGDDGNGRRLETYSFKTNGELYSWKDWQILQSGSIADDRLLNSEDGFHETKRNNAFDLPDFYAIAVWKSNDGRIFGRSKLYRKKDFQ